MKRINSFKTSNTTQNGVVNFFIKRQPNLWLFAFFMLFSSTGFTSNLCPCEGEGFTVGENMQSVTYISQTPLNNANNTLSGGCLTIHGQLIIDIDFTFDGVSVIAREGAEILVGGSTTSGVGNANKLIITNNSVLLGCDKMWRGITVDGLAAILEMENSIVRDAQYAIRLERGSEVKLTNNRFYGNYVGVFVPKPPIGQGGNTVVNSSGDFIKDNYFDVSFDYKTPYSGQTPNPGSIPYTGFLINDVSQFKVGASSNSTTPIKNYIRNIRNGIINIGGYQNSYYGFEITNLVSDPNSGQTPERHGIHIEVGREIRVYRNTMSDLDVGIYAQNYDRVIFFQNIMTEISLHGVQAINGGPNPGSSNLSSATVHSNTISMNGSNPAINILNSNSDNRPIRVESNTLYASNGIALEQIVGEVKVKDNTIIFDDINLGILLNNASGPSLIQDNYIEDTSLDGDHAGGGIILDQAGNAQVNTNTIIANDINAYSIGISTLFSTDVSFCCNTLDNAVIGTQFLGNCDDTHFATTTFGAHATGLRLVSARISNQNHTGNDWTADEAFIDAQFLGNYLEISFSEFFTDENLLSDGYNGIWVPTGATPQDWFALEGTDPTCVEWTNCGQPDFENVPNIPTHNELTDLDLYALEEAASGDETGKLLQWTAKQNLYEKLVNNPSLVPLDDDVEAFYLAAQNNLIGQFYDIDQRIKALFQIPAAVEPQYSDLWTDYDEASLELEAVEAALDTADVSEIPALMQQKENLIIELDSILANIKPLKTQIQTIKDAAITDILTDNAALITSEIYQNHQKTLNELFLNTLAQNNLELTQTEKNTIEAITEECPLIIGNDLFRGMILQNLYDSTFHYALGEDCIPVIERAESVDNKPEIQTTTATVFPNPTNGQLTIQFEKLLANSGELQITDISGKTVKLLPIQNGIQEVSMDLSTLPNGFYLLELIIEKESILVEKITILK